MCNSEGLRIFWKCAFQYILYISGNSRDYLILLKNQGDASRINVYVQKKIRVFFFDLQNFFFKKWAKIDYKIWKIKLYFFSKSCSEDFNAMW